MNEPKFGNWILSMTNGAVKNGRKMRNETDLQITSCGLLHKGFFEKRDGGG